MKKGRLLFPSSFLRQTVGIVIVNYLVEFQGIKIKLYKIVLHLFLTWNKYS